MLYVVVVINTWCLVQELLRSNNQQQRQRQCGAQVRLRCGLKPARKASRNLILTLAECGLLGRPCPQRQLGVLIAIDCSMVYIIAPYQSVCAGPAARHQTGQDWTRVAAKLRAFLIGHGCPPHFSPVLFLAAALCPSSTRSPYFTVPAPTSARILVLCRGCSSLRAVSLAYSILDSVASRAHRLCLRVPFSRRVPGTARPLILLCLPCASRGVRHLTGLA